LASAAGELGNNRENEMRLWDTRTGKEIRRWDGGTTPLSQVSFLPDGRLLAVEQGWSGVVRVWETSTGRQLHEFGVPRAAWSGVSPDGTRLALWGNRAVRVWDLLDQQIVGEVRPELGGLEGNLARSHRPQALSPGGRYLACAARHERGAIRIFQVATGEEVCCLQGYLTAAVDKPLWRDAVTALAWSDDGKLLASGSGEGSILLWDLATASAIRRCLGHEGAVTALAFSADDRTLLSGSDDTTALVWNLIGVRSFRNLSAKELGALWLALTGPSSEAFRAVFTLAAAPALVVPFFQHHLKPIAAVDEVRITQLIADLDSNQFAVRHKATQTLEECAELAESALQRKLQTDPSQEVRRRIGLLLDRLKSPPFGERLRALRAVEVLESIGTPDAEHLLRTLAQGAPEALLTREAKASLARLAPRRKGARRANQ
jgi:hypothetical protein